MHTTFECQSGTAMDAGDCNEKPDMTDPEKRWILRHHTILPIYCELSMGNECQTGWIREFSTVGASVITNLRLKVGDDVSITLAKKGQREVMVAATVRWKHGQLIGMEFKQTSKDLLFLLPLTSRAQ